MTESEKKLYSILPKGEANAITQQDITNLLGIDARETRLLIESMRKAGIIICATNAGRFLPESVDELRRYVKREQSMAESILISTSAAAKRLREWESEESGIDDRH